MKTSLLIAFWVATLSSLTCGLLAAHAALWAVTFRIYSTAGSATVLKVRERPNSDLDEIVFVFDDVHWQRHNGLSQAKRGSVNVGQAVAILYPETAPDEDRLDSFWGIWGEAVGWSLGCVLIGGLYSIVIDRTRVEGEDLHSRMKPKAKIHVECEHKEEG